MKTLIKRIILTYIVVSSVVFGVVYLANAYYMQDWAYLMHLDTEGREGVLVSILLCHLLIVPFTGGWASMITEFEIIDNIIGNYERRKND